MPSPHFPGCSHPILPSQEGKALPANGFKTSAQTLSWLKGSEVSGERGAQIGPQVGGQDSEFQPCPHYLKQDA